LTKVGDVLVSNKNLGDVLTKMGTFWLGDVLERGRFDYNSQLGITSLVSEVLYEPMRLFRSGFRLETAVHWSVQLMPWLRKIKEGRVATATQLI
jgi:hypothetical protein